MAHMLPHRDVVVIGVGWTGSILAKGLADAGLKVVGLERGKERHTVPDFQSPGMHDEYAYAVRHALMVDPSQETLTFRNNPDQLALPMRRLGSFLPGWSSFVYFRVGGLPGSFRGTWCGQLGSFVPWAGGLVGAARRSAGGFVRAASGNSFVRFSDATRPGFGRARRQFVCAVLVWRREAGFVCADFRAGCAVAPLRPVGDGVTNVRSAGNDMAELT